MAGGEFLEKPELFIEQGRLQGGDVTGEMAEADHTGRL